ncbi:MAG: glycine cleavage system H protein [Anaerolineae bacterium]|jgi:glycine cleavage system H protein
MEIHGFEFPDGLYYDDQHGWAKVEGDALVQGMTDFGQKIAQELVFVESPRVGREVEQGQTLLSLESGKWVGRIPAMASGKVAEVNEELEWEPDLINRSPYDEGWMVRIEMSDPSELDNLMTPDSDEFQSFIADEAEKYEELIS